MDHKFGLSLGSIGLDYHKDHKVGLSHGSIRVGLSHGLYSKVGLSHKSQDCIE